MLISFKNWLLAEDESLVKPGDRPPLIDPDRLYLGKKKKEKDFKPVDKLIGGNYVAN